MTSTEQSQPPAVDQAESAGELRTLCLLCGMRGVAVTCRRCGARTVVEVIVRPRPSAACFGVQTDASARGWGVDGKQ